MEGPPRYPFEILPKEMWEEIIFKVKDSEDIRNFMKVSKQLDNTFMKIHHLWLLDKVLPLLTSYKTCYLEDEDVKNLRQVDKRWCGAVNTFLENQPSLRPYNKDDDKLNSEEHIWSDAGFEHETVDESETIGTVTFTDYDLMNELPYKNPDCNPFLARSIIGWTQPDEDYDEDEENQTFWGKMNNDVFGMFGQHVWFLTMVWEGENNYQEWDAESMWRGIVMSLSSLPNLKGFQFEVAEEMEMISMSDSEAQEFLQANENQLPSLPFLESLKISRLNTLPELFPQQLVSKYFLQLRRLQMSVIDWDVSKNWTIPNLTELCLEDINAAKVTKVLESLEAPALAKLKLSPDIDENEFPTLRIEEEVFQWLTLFPSLLYLDISSANILISESGALKPGDSKPSLKYLKIYNSHGVNYNFLRCLPNLERLQICLNEKPVVWDCSAYPDIKIKLELETCSLYHSNVWELCPKLRTLSLTYPFYEDFEDRGYAEFDRVTYKKLKNIPSSEERKCAELRPDIIDFLQNPESDSESDWDEDEDEP